MVQKFICILVLLYSFFGYTQKIVKKSILNSSISSIEIDGANCFLVEVLTKDIKEVIVEATIEGEYKRDLIITIKKDIPSLQIRAEFQPIFVNPNDKLSAHKVVSIALKITIPKDKDVSVLGTSSTFIGFGVYKRLRVSLKDGLCELANISGKINIETQSGDIIVKKSAGNFVLNSKYGKVQEDIMPKGNSEFYLATNTGNIQVMKM